MLPSARFLIPRLKPRLQRGIVLADLYGPGVAANLAQRPSPESRRGDHVVSKLSLSSLLVVSLSIVLMICAACVPPATPVPPTPAASSTITGIVWQWTSVTNQTTRETSTVPNPEDYTIVFNADGTLTGKADCNTFAGTYSQEGGFSITIGATTMAACGEDSLDGQYLQLLGAVAAGGPDGTGGLALETAGGEQRMIFANGGAAPAP